MEKKKKWVSQQKKIWEINNVEIIESKQKNETKL
jgi:hypothetical protein